MKCRKCNAENPDDAKYCRACGERLPQGNAMERLAGYHFVPVSIGQLKGAPEARGGMSLVFPFLLVVTFFFVHALLSMAFPSVWEWRRDQPYERVCINRTCASVDFEVSDLTGMYGASFGHYYYDVAGTCPEHGAYDATECERVRLEVMREYNGVCMTHIFGWGVGLLCLVLIVTKGGLMERSFPNRFKMAQLRKEADYIQSYKSSAEKFVFILKDDKFGVYDVKKFKVRIPPIYDELSWKEQKRLLYATQGGRRYVIDIYGNELK